MKRRSFLASLSALAACFLPKSTLGLPRPRPPAPPRPMVPEEYPKANAELVAQYATFQCRVILVHPPTESEPWAVTDTQTRCKKTGKWLVVLRHTSWPDGAFRVEPHPDQ